LILFFRKSEKPDCRFPVGDATRAPELRMGE
jgi:hypothetical protein